jgi:hypothetical protein
MDVRNRKGGQDFPLFLVTSQIMIPMKKTTSKTPTQTPALKIPPIMAQLFNRNIIITIRSDKKIFICFNLKDEKSCQD